mgnify:FL=1
MNIRRKCINLSEEEPPVFFEFKNISTCPRCQTPIPYGEGKIPPVFFPHTINQYVTIFNFCSHCELYFMTTFSVEKSYYDDALVATKQIASEQITPKAIEFSPLLTEISSNFVEIYNQAYQAEIYSLNHISGMGYRKALEFLIKDYAIHFNLAEAETIKEQALAQCIKAYIDNPKIKTLAERSAWLGNDEVHYVRKHPDFDINDLKRFIDTCVNYIEMELNLEQCNSIQKA